jgi:hypothetical protein
MGKYMAKVGGTEVEIDISFTVSSTISEKDGITPTHKVGISSFTVGDMEIKTVTTANAKDTLGTFYSVGKEKLWGARGDNQESTRCFVATKGGEAQAFFNTGIAKINVTHNERLYEPNESFGKNGSLSDAELAQFVFGVNLYFDLVYRANSQTFTPKIIYTTNDESMSAALMTSGWTNIQAEKDIGEDVSFFDALVAAPPDAADGRGPRFQSVDGQFQERSKWDESTKESEYDAMGVFAYEGFALEQATFVMVGGAVGSDAGE